MSTTSHMKADDCIGILHPGEMGSALATLLTAKGVTTFWVPSGRSQATFARANDAGMISVPSLEELCRRCPIIISVCPPHGALDTAEAVATLEFQGLYLDANAIAPDHARHIQDVIIAGGGRYLDGAIVGPPPRPGSSTRLYLSGLGGDAIGDVFAGTGLNVIDLGPEPFRASALKMCHSAAHKAQLALTIATLACADHYDVRDALWNLLGARPDTARLVQNIDGDLRRLAKAWRFAGEMRQVAATFEPANLPTGIHLGAADIFDRLAHLTGTVSLDQVLEALQANPQTEPTPNGSP